MARRAGSLMISATIKLGAVTAALDGLPAQVVKAVAKKVQALAVNLQHHIVADKLQGQVLKHRSGALGQSIQTETTTTGPTTTGEVFSAGDVKYAAIHECGFHGVETVRQHVRTMAFGREVAPFLCGPFTRQVDLPERSFMRSSLDDHAERIVAGIREAALAGAKQSLGR